MKRILFVDDETAVLDGIRTMLRKRRDEWQVECADSAAAALAILEKQPVDLICSDMRMPVMDGAQLLQTVSERWPQTVRIVLSGYAEIAQTIRLVPIAHQYLSKPCSAEQLQNTVERCLRMRDLLERPGLCALVGRVNKLPTLPRIYSQLREVMAKQNATANDVAKIISADVAVAGKVLQVANSAFFRLARTVTKIEQAVTHLGFVSVRNLVMSVEVFSQWPKGRSGAGIDLERFNGTAMQVGATARALSAGTPFMDDAMIAGMLHDIGYLVFINDSPQKLDAAGKLAKQKGISMSDAEREVFGASHTEVGAYLLALWGLPYNVVEAVAHHHEPLAVQHGEFDMLGAVALAEVAVRTACKQDTTHSPVIDADFLQALHAPFTYEGIMEIVDSVKSVGAAAA